MFYIGGTYDTKLHTSRSTVPGGSCPQSSRLDSVFTKHLKGAPRQAVFAGQFSSQYSHILSISPFLDSSHASRTNQLHGILHHASIPQKIVLPFRNATFPHLQQGPAFYLRGYLSVVMPLYFGFLGVSSGSAGHNISLALPSS